MSHRLPRFRDFSGSKTTTDRGFEIPSPELHDQQTNSSSSTRTAHSPPSQPPAYLSIDYFGSPERHSGYHSSPERRRSRDSVVLLKRVPEDNAMEFPQVSPRFTAGTTLYFDEDDDNEWELDEVLAEQGLYRGSYKRLLLIYTLTPFTTLLFFAFFAYLPTLAFSSSRDAKPPLYPYVSYLPFPAPELLTSIALWSLAYLLRDPLFMICFLFLGSSRSTTATIISTFLHTVISLLLRAVAIPLLLINNQSANPTWRDESFKRVWWVALGWAAAEAAVGIQQGYEGIALYRDVLVSVRRGPELDPEPVVHAPSCRHHSDTHAASTVTSSSVNQRLLELDTSGSEEATLRPRAATGEREPLISRKAVDRNQVNILSSSLEREVEHDLDQLIAIKSREELEEVYGMPVIKIPVFISCLHRINCLVASLGIFLLISATYLRSQFPVRQNPTTTNVQKSNTQLFVTLYAILALRLFLSYLHTPFILPKIGVHTYVYVSCLVSLGMFFAGLGMWEALI